jgi:hypothetical protein
MTATVEDLVCGAGAMTMSQHVDRGRDPVLVKISDMFSPNNKRRETERARSACSRRPSVCAEKRVNLTTDAPPSSGLRCWPNPPD